MEKEKKKKRAKDWEKKRKEQRKQMMRSEEKEKYNEDKDKWKEEELMIRKFNIQGMVRGKCLSDFRPRSLSRATVAQRGWSLVWSPGWVPLNCSQLWGPLHSLTTQVQVCKSL